MRETFIEAKAVIENSGYTLEQIREYLDDLRVSGRLNMYGSGDYLMNVWGFSRSEVKPIVLEYITCGLHEEKEPDHLSYGVDRPTEDQDDDSAT